MRLLEEGSHYAVPVKSKVWQQLTGGEADNVFVLLTPFVLLYPPSSILILKTTCCLEAAIRCALKNIMSFGTKELI